jgi:SH3-like domain-containing protein
MARATGERRGHFIRHAAIAGAIIALAFGAGAARAADDEAGLKVPRFVSLHSDKVNLRSGPGRQYPIEWVLTKRDMPVEIIAQFEHWRRVREWDGTVGWVQAHMVNGKRYVIVDKGAVHSLYRQPDPSSGIVARAEPGVVARLAECRGGWCRVETDDVAGWLKRGDLWGVYPDETVP